jgi:hypothetical protein
MPKENKFLEGRILNIGIAIIIGRRIHRYRHWQGRESMKIFSSAIFLPTIQKIWSTTTMPMHIWNF